METKKFLFNRNGITVGYDKVIEQPSIDVLKNTPALWNASLEDALKYGGESDKFYIVVREKDGTENVLTNEDSLFMWKFDSAEVQAKVHKGESYEFKLRGYRVPFLSAFPNVDSTKALK
ncbi:TPA: DUF1523 family protein [Bacillus cereus]|uniref:DUF1523 family protein n=1 Tax=Bacillus cereus group TaxID=86661 RepID=UPI000BA22364|nr:DUF1523 family protein [Bacillus thuringiensis]